MAEPGASIQLIVFGERNQSDPSGVLKDVATAGFRAIEAGNLYDSHGEEATRKMLSENGLTVSGAHFGYGDYADEARLVKNIAYAKAAGIRYMMCSGVADSKSADGYRDSARVFNEAGKRMAEEGISFHYHNHDWEFHDLGGVNGMTILSQETDPAVVKFNIDVFWVHYAGKDPVAFIGEHADRAGYFHFKDGRTVTGQDGKPKPEFTELGRGEVDLKAAYQAALKVGAKWIVSEQDHSHLPAVEAATISRNYLRDVLGV